MQEKQGTQVRSLGRKDPLEEKIGSHSSVLSWRIPWTEEPGRLYSPRGHKESNTSEQVNNDDDVEPLAMCLVAIFTSYLENDYSVLSF